MKDEIKPTLLLVVKNESCSIYLGQLNLVLLTI